MFPVGLEGAISSQIISIRNETEYPIILQSSASGNTVVSFGPVTDRGTGNKVSRMKQPKSKED